MIKNVQVWSHRDKEYLVPLSETYRAKAQELIYPRVSIASVFNGSKTLFGVAIQHPDDVDNKAVGQEAAVENALIKPVMVLNCVKPVTEKAFDKFAWALYESYSPLLKPIAQYAREYFIEDDPFEDYFDDFEEDDCDCNCNCKDCDCDCDCDCGCGCDCENTWASTCPGTCKTITCTDPLKEPVYIY